MHRRSIAISLGLKVCSNLTNLQKTKIYIVPKKKRVKIPAALEAEVIYKSDFKCCICQQKGDQIHHVDSDPSNNNINNLALLCFNHHDNASITGSLSKKLSRQTILNYREHHYKVIEFLRQKQLGVFESSTVSLTEEKLLIIAKNANIIIELEKIKEQYFNAELEKKVDVLSQLGKFVNHSNHRLALDIFDFLSIIAGQTSLAMTYNLGSSIYEMVLNFFPSFYDEEKRPQTIELAKKCIHLGENIAYDSFLYLKNIATAMWGLTIIKFIYRSAKQYNIIELTEAVNLTYKELESIFKTNESKDLNDAQQMLEYFRLDLDVWSLSFPNLSPHLMERLENDKKNN